VKVEFEGVENLEMFLPQHTGWVEGLVGFQFG
jgi:hypothetical protein